MNKIFHFLFDPWARSFRWAKNNPILAIFALAGIWVFSTAFLAWFVFTVGKIFGESGLAVVAKRWVGFVVGLALTPFPALWPVVIVLQLAFGFAFLRDQLDSQ